MNQEDEIMKIREQASVTFKDLMPGEAFKWATQTGSMYMVASGQSGEKIGYIDLVTGQFKGILSSSVFDAPVVRIDAEVVVIPANYYATKANEPTVKEKIE